MDPLYSPRQVAWVPPGTNVFLEAYTKVVEVEGFVLKGKHVSEILKILRTPCSVGCC